MWTCRWELPVANNGLHISHIFWPMVVPRKSTCAVRPNELANAPRLVTVNQRQRGEILTELSDFDVKKNANKVVVKKTIEKFARR